MRPDDARRAKGNRRAAFGFVVPFAAASALLLLYYYYPHAEGSSAKRLFDGELRAYATAAGALLHLFDASVRVQGQDIAGRYALRIVNACTATDVQVLLACAILCWPGAWMRRAAAAALGIAALAALNLFRICSLYFVGVHFPTSFRFVHLDLWPALIVVLAAGGFYFYTRLSRTDDALPNGTP
jgi:exosortase/archaeosortase family protein